MVENLLAKWVDSILIGFVSSKVNILGDITANINVFLEAVRPFLKRQSDQSLVVSLCCFLVSLFQCIGSDPSRPLPVYWE
jgi:hypothetical protein